MDNLEDKTLEYVRELAIQIQKDPSQRGRVLKLLTGDSNAAIARLLSIRKHNMPYYKAHFAMELKFILDRMIQSRRTQEFRYIDFPRLSKHSLYLKVYQSFLYLIDHADPDGEYIKLRNDTEIFKSENGVRIRCVNKDRAPLNVAEEVDDAAPPLPPWRVKIDGFLQNGKVGEKLIIDKLSLTTEQVEDLQTLLQEVDGVLFKLEPHRVLLVKPRPEDLAALQQ